MKTICVKCVWGCTLNHKLQKETWCSNDHFKLRQGYNNFPKVSECRDFNPPRDPSLRNEQWEDLYTDATGQCFSDADNGL